MQENKKQDEQKQDNGTFFDDFMGLLNSSLKTAKDVGEKVYETTREVGGKVTKQVSDETKKMKEAFSTIIALKKEVDTLKKDYAALKKRIVILEGKKTIKSKAKTATKAKPKTTKKPIEKSSIAKEKISVTKQDKKDI